MAQQRWLVPAMLFTAAAVCACSGGTSGGLAPSARPATTTQTVTLVLAIPRTAPAASWRSPSYVPPNAASISVTITAAGTTTTSTLNVTPSTCPVVNGSATCTVTLDAPIGNDSFAVSIYDGLNGTGIDPSSLSANPIPIRFLDADGEEIFGTFAYPVTVASSNPSVLFPATAAGTSIFATPVVSDTTVTGPTYPAAPGYEIKAGVTTEGYAQISATANLTALNVSYGTSFTNDPGSQSKNIYVDHHVVAAANLSGTNVVNLYGVSANNLLGLCDTITTPLQTAATVIADGANGVLAVAGPDAGSPSYLGDVVEYQLTPSTAIVDLTGSAPRTSLANGMASIAETPGTLSLARSAATHSLYLANSVAREVQRISDAAYPLNSTATYQTGTPALLVVGSANSIAVVNTSNNGDVLFVPDSNTGQNVGIVTHAESSGLASGMNYNLHTVTPDGPEPLYGYSAASYSNGAARQIAFTLYDNGVGYIHSFDATFSSAPTFNRILTGTPATGANTLTTGSGDTDYYAIVGGQICFNAVSPPSFPYNCNGSASAIASAGDNTYLALVNGSNLIIYDVAIYPAATFTYNSQAAAQIGAVPAVYTR